MYMTQTTGLIPTDTNHRLGELQRVYVRNAEITQYADLVADGLVRRGRDGYIAWTRKAARRMALAHVTAESKAYPTR